MHFIKTEIKSKNKAWASIRSLMKTCVFAFASFALVGGSVLAPTHTVIPLVNAAVAEDERKALEAQLKELEGQIDEYEGQITGYQKQGSSLKGEISRLNSNITKLNLQVRAINLTISQLDTKIVDTKEKIVTTEDKIESNKEAIQALLATLYQSEQTGLMSVFLENPSVSDFFNDLNSLSTVRNNLQVVLAQVKELHTQLIDQKTQLSLARADTETAKVYQDRQRAETERARKEKDGLLAVTKGQEVKYQALLKQTKATAAQIRSRIFQLLGGGEMSFEQAYDFAKIASSATGIRPALLLAVLDRESALGKNVGRCGYKTAMNPKEHTTFLGILAALNLDPEAVMVSCPNADGVYGGAMGPAQFIPSTWKGYEEEIKKITGEPAVSPWNSAHAFVATALYLRDAGAAGGTITSERQAAAKYYAGGRWRSYLWTYGEAVVSRAAKFQDDIDTITG